VEEKKINKQWKKRPGGGGGETETLEELLKQKSEVLADVGRIGPEDKSKKKKGKVKRGNRPI